MATISVSGADVVDIRGQAWTFASGAEARAKAAFVAEALSWVGTPFRDCADVKGPDGAVDCAMLLTRCGVDTGLRPAFDPRPYPPRHMMSSSDERFLGWVRDKLGGQEVEAPRLGDLAIWRFGRVFAHGGIMVSAGEIVHSYAHAGRVVVSRLDEPFLMFAALRGVQVRRPVKFFDVWRKA